jgi:ABC-2 type transport system ATP-binding protein
MGSATSAANTIQVRRLARSFKGVTAVDGIDLDVAPGEIRGFLGPNGAGKSTTVAMLVTLLRPSAGGALVAGHDIVREAPAVRRVIGVALQDVALDATLTAREHARLQGALHGLPGAERARRGDELLERFGLAAVADRRVGGFSGGMKRRLDLALALVHRPRVLFLDEPTTGLDIQSRTALWHDVRSLARDEGVTVFLTTQYLDEADALADRVDIIAAGRIVASDTPAALKAEFGRPTVVVRPADEADTPVLVATLAEFGRAATSGGGAQAVQLLAGVDLSDIVRALDGRGIAVAELQLQAPSLDDVFLAKTGHSLEGAAPSPPSDADDTHDPELVS